MPARRPRVWGVRGRPHAAVRRRARGPARGAGGPRAQAECRPLPLLGSDRQITLRSTHLWELVPGDIVTVQPRKRWIHARHPYISGEILGWRFAPQELGLVPLRLEPKGIWDPGSEAFVGVEPRVRPTLEAGPPRVFEMEDAVPDGDDGAILEAIGACEARDFEHARQVLGDLLARDLRCIAARWLLASIEFRVLPLEALRYHESGVRIGDLSFPRASTACCRGPGPAIGPSSVACTATACASGA